MTMFPPTPPTTPIFPPSTPVDFDRLMRRVELLERITDLIRTSDPATEAREKEAPEPRRRAPATSTTGKVTSLMPRIKVVDRHVLCGGHALDLARRPMTLRLFQAFCAAPGLELPRDAVIELVHGRLDEGRSPRYLESLHAKTIKLISRSRILAATYLSHGPAAGVDWFVYNQDRRSWQLFQMRNRYLERAGESTDD